jgi:leader peptidase (prepilin peptidase) / N-methyltransferase
MAWAFAAVAVALAVLVALWLRRRTYRRFDDIVYRELNPWWLPVLAGVGVIVAAPFYYQRPPLVLFTYLLALVWGLTLAFIDIEVRRLPDAIVLPAYPVAAALLTACSAITSDWTALLRSAACAGAAVAGFLILALLSPRGKVWASATSSWPAYWPGCWAGWAGCAPCSACSPVSFSVASLPSSCSCFAAPIADHTCPSARR